MTIAFEVVLHGQTSLMCRWPQGWGTLVPPPSCSDGTADVIPPPNPPVVIEVAHG